MISTSRYSEFTILIKREHETKQNKNKAKKKKRKQQQQQNDIWSLHRNK